MGNPVFNTQAPLRAPSTASSTALLPKRPESAASRTPPKDWSRVKLSPFEVFSRTKTLARRALELIGPGPPKTCRPRSRLGPP